MLDFFKNLFKKKDTTIVPSVLYTTVYNDSMPKNTEKNIKPYTFKLNAVESYRYDEFKKKHLKDGLHSIVFTPNGIGITKKCICEKKKLIEDITDYNTF